MFEESDVEVLVFTRSFRIVRGEDASQVAAVDWRWRNEDGVRPVPSRTFEKICCPAFLGAGASIVVDPNLRDSVF